MWQSIPTEGPRHPSHTIATWKEPAGSTRGAGAVARGEIPEDRLESYRRLQREARHLEAKVDERAALWQQVISAHKRYAGYQQRTDREIPLVVLSPR